LNELPAPPDAGTDPQATELLRVWIVGQALHCSLRPDAFPDPGTWGEVLADVVRYVADALRQQEGKDPGETVRLIRSVFDAEMDAPAAGPDEDLKEM
jgi:hypothetical protein